MNFMKIPVTNRDDRVAVVVLGPKAVISREPCDVMYTVGNYHRHPDALKRTAIQRDRASPEGT